MLYCSKSRTSGEKNKGIFQLRPSRNENYFLAFKHWNRNISSSISPSQHDLGGWREWKRKSLPDFITELDHYYETFDRPKISIFSRSAASSYIRISESLLLAINANLIYTTEMLLKEDWRLNKNSCLKKIISKSALSRTLSSHSVKQSGHIIQNTDFHVLHQHPTFLVGNRDK